MSRRRLTPLSTTLTVAVASLGLGLAASPVAAGDPAEPAPASENGAPGFGRDRLRVVAPEDLHIGSAAAGGGHHETMPYPDPFTYDHRYRNALRTEFDSVSPENQMKWEFIHPEQDTYRFGPADAIVEFAEKNDQVVRGHTLMWHSQNPDWLENGDFTDAELRQILKDHITTVVGRYAGRIHQWDVANEIFDGSGALRTEENIWLRRLGPDIIADAFRWAHEADPQAQLFFNDWGVESINAKSDAYYDLITSLLDQGVPVHGFSVQGHLSIQFGFPGSLQANLQRFADLGLYTAVTELDVRMVLGEDGTPTAAQLARQADYYGRMLDACLAVSTCNSFTVWGFNDKYSWVPVFFPNQGAATLMFEDYRRKPAYYTLQNTLAAAN